MANELFLRMKFLREYLREIYQYNSDDSIENLKEGDFTRYNEIRNAESEYARLEYLLFQQKHQQENEKKDTSSSNSEELQQLDLFTGLPVAQPTRPKQTRMQALKSTTMFTPLPSIVEEGYNRRHRGINWPHYENMLKLFALKYMVQGIPTQQQEKDIIDLTKAVEEKGNARYKKKHLTAEEITERDSGVYMRYGKNVIRSMAEMDPLVSERRLKDLRTEISDTRNENNSVQLHKMMSKAKTIFITLQSRYRVR